MKFSLWMIRETLKEFQTEVHIEEEEQRTIENIRLFYPGSKIRDHILYIESSDAFFKDGDNAVACVHGRNILWVKTSSVNAIFNLILQSFEEWQRWEQKISRMITSNCLLKDVLNQFSGVLPLPLMVLDNGQMVHATSDNYGRGMVDAEWDIGLQTGRFQPETLTAYNRLYQSKVEEKGYYEVPADPFPYQSYNRNIFIGNEFVGFITMILVRRIREVYKDWFDIACGVILDWITLYMQQNEILLRQEILSELLGGKQEHFDRFTNSMQTVGWKERDRKNLLLLRCISDTLNMNQHIAKVLNQESNALYAIEYQNDIAVLMNDELMPAKKFSEEIAPLLQKSGYYGGVSDYFTDTENLYQYYLQARIALTHGETQAGLFHHIKDHMVPYIFQLMSNQNELDMRHPALEAMKEYDRVHKTDYYEVLKEYLKSGCSQTLAAEKLFLHRNSLIRKLEKIRELFNLDLDVYEIRLHLMMSYEMDFTEQRV